MKKSVILNDNQVTRLQQTGMVVVVDMVKYPKTVEEPTFGYTAFTPENHISLRGYFNWEEDGIKQRRYGEKFINKPYQPGSTLYVREKWVKANYILRPAATMPKSVARLFPIVDKVECVRVKDVDLKLIENIVEGTGISEWKDYLKPNDYPYLNRYNSFASFITHRFGQSFWDGNGWLFLTTLKLTK